LNIKANVDQLKILYFLVIIHEPAVLIGMFDFSKKLLMSKRRGRSFPSTISWFNSNEFWRTDHKKFENGAGSGGGYSSEGR